MVGKKTALSVAVIFIAVYLRRYGFPGKRLAPIVTTAHGKLQGVIAYSRDGREYFSYLGVPYAKQPIDALRFEPPEPVDSWSGVRDATEYSSPCIQFDLMANQYLGEEACVYLNIHTPQVPTGDLLNRPGLPVLTFFHGGLFTYKLD